MRPYADAKAVVDVLGMVSITGEPEAWQIESHQSFASIEDLDKAVGAAAPSQEASRTLIALPAGATGPTRLSGCFRGRTISISRFTRSGRTLRTIWVNW